MLTTFTHKLRKYLGTKSEQLVGFACHANCVYAVKLEKDKLGWFVSEHASETVENESMWPVAIAALSQKLALKQAAVNIVIPPFCYQRVQIDTPNVEDDELQSAIPWAIKPLINSAVEDLVIDYYSQPVVPALESAKLNVIATPKTIAESIVNACLQAKLRLKIITIEELVCANIAMVEESIVMYVTQGVGEEVSLKIVKDGILYFTRRLRGFNRIGDYTAEEVTSGLADTLALEIQRSVDYFEGQLKQPPVRKALVSLNSHFTPQLVETLNQDSQIHYDMLEISPALLRDEHLPQCFFGALSAACAKVSVKELLDAA
ncbi:hypothetical protein [Flocculibacter collagenilyticus]|uniref:hypothetical protein n=1 Tax=Flocculibacter collagenilyticus TaxID=2744479 RepID=UPI0018F52A8D|nr:hypothetical protein [Flocculibacter collagenilyticus]